MGQTQCIWGQDLASGLLPSDLHSKPDRLITVTCTLHIRSRCNTQFLCICWHVACNLLTAFYVCFYLPGWTVTSSRTGTPLQYISFVSPNVLLKVLWWLLILINKKALIRTKSFHYYLSCSLAFPLKLALIICHSEALVSFTVYLCPGSPWVGVVGREEGK